RVATAPVALENELPVGGVELGPRDLRRYAAPAAELEELAAFPRRRLRRPRLQRPPGDRPRGIRNDQCEVGGGHPAEAAACLARAARAAEDEEVRDSIADG